MSVSLVSKLEQKYKGESRQISLERYRGVRSCRLVSALRNLVSNLTANGRHCASSWMTLENKPRERQLSENTTWFTYVKCPEWVNPRDRKYIKGLPRAEGDGGAGGDG